MKKLNIGVNHMLRSKKKEKNAERWFYVKNDLNRLFLDKTSKGEKKLQKCEVSLKKKN